MERNVMENFRRYQQQCTTLFGKLDEQNRRHVAGLIALTLGHGGVCFVAELTGLDRPCTINTVVSRGKHELLDNLSDCPSGRQRKPGAGRRFLDKKVRTSSNASKKSLQHIPAANRPGCNDSWENSSD